MIIKYCPKCAGKPYTNDTSVQKCPICKTKLQVESVEEEELEGRSALSVSTMRQSDGNLEYPREEKIESDYMPFDSHTAIGHGVSTDSGWMCGRVSSYSCTTSEGNAYHRFTLTKLYHYFLLGQRMEDTLHRFTLWPEDSESQSPVTVNIHGKLSTGAGIRDNMEVKVYGKMHSGVFFAQKVYAVFNETETPINFQNDFGQASTILFCAAVTVFFLLALFSGCVGEWIMCSVKAFLGLLLVYFLLSITKFGILLRVLSHETRRIPWRSLTLLSMLLSLLTVSGITKRAAIALGATLQSAISGVIGTILVIVILVAIIKLLLFGK